MNNKILEKMKGFKNILIKYLICAILFVSVSCADLDVNPSDRISADVAITNIEDMGLAVNGAYDNLTSGNYYHGKYLLLGDFMGDDLMNPPISQSGLLLYNYIWSEKNVDNSFYSYLYRCIGNINDILKRSEFLKSDPIYQTYCAELKALRALHHFDLVKLYGPLYANLGKGQIKSDALGITIRKEPVMDMYAKFKRNTVKEVYEFVVDELESCLGKLPISKKTRLNENAARLLLARIYLYMGDVKFKNITDNYEKALSYVNQIKGYSIISKKEYVASWGKDFNSESIFELPTTVKDNPRQYSVGNMVSFSFKGKKDACATKDFMSLYCSDVRFNIFSNYKLAETVYNFPNKKFPGKQNESVNNIAVLRYSEAVLIKAECELKLKRPADAAITLNKLRSNRTEVKPNKYSADITIDDILYERRLELFCEGHRAWDLWRNQKFVKRYSSIEEKRKEGHNDFSDGEIEFDHYQTIYPISEQEMQFAIDKNQQNPNY